MRLHGFRDRTEDDPVLLEPVAECRGDGDAVEDGIDRDIAHARQNLLFLQRDAELGVSLEKLRIDLVETQRPVGRRFWRRIVVARLVVDRRIADLRPDRFGHGEPVAVGLEAPLEKPVGFFLLRGDEADGVLRETLGRAVGFDVGDETVLVGAGHIADGIDGFLYDGHGQASRCCSLG